MTTDPADRRRAPRAVVSWRGVLAGEAGQRVDAKIIDISLVGAAALVGASIAPQTRLVLQCSPPLPDKPQLTVPLRIECSVVRQEMKADAFRTGLLFLGNLSDEAWRLIDAWVANAGLRHWR